MSRRVATILVVAALAASACGGDGDVVVPVLVTTTTSATPESPASTASTTLDDGEPASSDGPDVPDVPTVVVTQVDCPADLARSDGRALACGVVTVPVDRADPSAGTTRITIATLAGDDAGATTPLAVLQGGPGGASSDLGAWFPQQAFTQVFVDQRGTGFAGPDFDCPEIADALEQMLVSGSASAGVVADAAYDGCARRLRDEPVLAHTGSEAHAADVVDVMAALGYTEWVAYGVSYGSTIALEIARDEPTGVAGVVLDGVYPPELDADVALVFSAERAVDQIDVACTGVPRCRDYLADGSFRRTLERVMADLDRSPIIVPVIADGLGDDGTVDVVLDGNRVAEFVFLLMYHESLLRHLPAVIGGLDERDAASARWLATTATRLLASSQEANREGTYFAVQCHERLPFASDPGDDVAPFGAAITAARLPEQCDEWEREAAPPEADDAVEGTVSTLLLSGSFDPITPPEFADDVAERLAAATAVEQGGRGHGIWYGSDCIAGIVERFVADPTGVLDTSCAETPVPVEWARP